jgi:hypothetical protein
LWGHQIFSKSANLQKTVSIYFGEFLNSMNAGIKIEKKRNQEVFDGFTIFHYNVALCDLYRKGISRNFLGDTFCILDNFYF